VKSGNVVLCIYDATGREIGKLVDEHQPEGNHKVLWNGKTSSGERAATGVYYSRLRFRGSSGEARKILLVK
jgi:flagellar hook assembly protein FlgD